MKRTFVWTLVALLVAVSGSAAVVVPDPPPVITDVFYLGTGCPLESITELKLAPTAESFLVKFDEKHFVVELKKDEPLAEAIKKCDISFNLQIPAGYMVAISGVELKGQAELVLGAKGVQKTSLVIPGQVEQLSTTGVIPGPIAGPYAITNPIEPEELVFSPCALAPRNINVNINTQLRVIRGESELQSLALIVPASERELVQQVFKLVWRTCTPTL